MEETDHAQDEIRALGGTLQIPKQVSLTMPIDKFLARKQAPVKYKKTGDLQRRLDLEIMTLVATSNLPFSFIDSKPFVRWAQAVEMFGKIANLFKA